MTDLSAEEAVSDREIIIWREAENLTADWGLAQHRPPSHRDDPNWFSGKGGVRAKLPEAFTWQFRIKEEVQQDTLKPLERKYRVWVRIYYYARTKLSAQFYGEKIGEFDAAMDTEKVYFRSGTFYWAPLGDFSAVGGTQHAAHSRIGSEIYHYGLPGVREGAWRRLSCLRFRSGCRGLAPRAVLGASL